MEENKVTKISLSTFFLILSLIVIIIMGIFIYKFYNEKIEATKESDDLKTQVNSLTETVNNLQGKIDNISSTINSDNSTENTNSTNGTSFTDEQVKIALSNYLELRAHLNCNTLLNKLTEKGDLKYDNSQDIETSINGTEGYYITNVKYSDYRNAMLKYVSKSEFERNWNSYYSEDSNGNLIASDGGGTARVYTIKSITKTNNLTYSAKTAYVIDENSEEENFNFVVTSYNGNCVIDSIK